MQIIKRATVNQTFKTIAKIVQAVILLRCDMSPHC